MKYMIMICYLYHNYYNKLIMIIADWENKSIKTNVTAYKVAD